MIKEYSGIVESLVSTPLNSTTLSPVSQTFNLPSNFVRGDSVVPYLTGLQVLIESTVENITLSWSLNHYNVNTTGNWDVIGSGTATQAAVVGNPFWINLYNETLITINPSWVNDLFQFVITLDSNTKLYYCGSDLIGIPTYPVVNLAQYEGNYITDATTGVCVQFPYSILGLVADSGVDILGNTYRSCVVPNLPTNMDTNATEVIYNSYWMSRPNPSESAVEAIYIDIRDDNYASTTFDNILLDPITQGIQFNVYYSDDDTGNVGNACPTEADVWDNKLWTHIAKVFKAVKRDTYAMPYPVTANYIKIEFTNLKGAYYNPKGNPIVVYNKYPTWVNDYFQNIINPQRLGEDYFVGQTQTTQFDFLDFAYSYYTGEAIQTSAMPSAIIEEATAEMILQQKTTHLVDNTTVSQINGDLRPYQSQPVLQGPNDYLPGQSASALGTYTQTVNYTTEQTDPNLSLVPTSNTGNYTQSLNKDALLQQKLAVPMYFWLTCRHQYQKNVANFDNSRAYFAGIRELAFLRQDFNVPVDQPIYWENFGDNFNGTTIQ